MEYMFSFEIQNFLEQHNYHINHDDERLILNTSSQLNHIKFEQNEGEYSSFNWWTDDGYNWLVHIKNII